MRAWLLGCVVLHGCVRYCTEGGCESGFSVALTDAEGAALLDAAGVLVIDGFDHAFDCADPSFEAPPLSCFDGELWVRHMTPDAVTLRLDGDEVGFEVPLDYDTVTVGGPDCAQDCRVGSATVTLTRS